MYKEESLMWAPTHQDYYVRGGLWFKSVMIQYEHLCSHNVDTVDYDRNGGHNRLTVGFDSRGVH
jgi:hypothetical protein